MHSKKLLLIGNYGAGNLGDDAILGGLLDLLKSTDFKGEILVTSGSKKTSHEIYEQVKRVPFAPSGLRSWLRNKGSAMPKEWENVNAAVLGGGGLFVDEESWRAPWIWARQSAALQKSGIPYMGFGQSIGGLNWFSQWALKSSLHPAKIYHVRDFQSLERLKKISKTHSFLKTPFQEFNLKQGSDLALHLKLENLIKDPQKKPPNLHREAVALIHLRLWPGISRGHLSELYNTLVNQITDRGLKPILFSMEPHNLEEIALLRELDPELFIPQSVTELIHGLRKASLVVGMRLHGSLLSAMTETPTLALSYSDKVSGLLRQFENLQILPLHEPKLSFDFKAPIHKSPHLLKENQTVLQNFLDKFF